MKVGILVLFLMLRKIGQIHAKKKEKEKERKKKLDHILALYTRIDSKWIKDLNVHPHTIKLLEENESSNLSDIATSNLFLDVPP